MKRFYSCEVVIYSDPSFLSSILHDWDYVRHYLIAFHDKDVTSEGLPLKEHCHVYLTFRANVSVPYVAKNLTLISQGKFSVLDNNVEMIKGSYRDCYLYATHKNEPDKFQYSDDILFSDDLRFWRRNYSSTSNDSYQMISDLEHGVSLRELAQKYGRDFILNYNRYLDFLVALHEQERPKPVPVPSVQVDFLKDND